MEEGANMFVYQVVKSLKEYEPQTFSQASSKPLLDTEPLPPLEQPLEEDVLYIASGPIPSEYFTFPIHLLWLGGFLPNNYQDPACVIVLSHCPDPAAVVRRVHDLFKEEWRLAGFSSLLLNMLADNSSVQAVVEKAHQFWGRLIFVFDAGFSLIAANWETIDRDPDARHFIENRYMTPEDMKAINFDHIHQRAMRSEAPVLVRNPHYRGDRIVARLNFSHKTVGHVVITAGDNSPFSSFDYQAMAVLRDIIVQIVQRDEFMRNSRGFHYEHLICDLLDGKIPLGQQLQDRLAYLDFHFEQLTYIMVAELARTPQFLNPSYVRNRLESLLMGSRSILYNGQILLLTTRRETDAISCEELDAVSSYCQKAGLYCGLSNSFERVAQLPQFYQQALRALELGASDHPGLFNYQNYAAEHVAALFRAKESAEAFCHPVVRRLVEYDREHRTDLTATLYHFLRCERNVVHTAEVMHLHRNTLSYRLKKILDFTHLNLDDPENRQYLMLSLLVDQTWAKSCHDSNK